MTFTESGLPANTNWSVTLNGTVQHSLGTSIQFGEANGIYSFTVGAVSGFTSTPSTGQVTVNNQPSSQAIGFAASGGPQNTGPPLRVPTFLGLPEWEGVTITAVVLLVTALILLSFLGCPNKCTPEGKKKGCTYRVVIDTTPCGTPPDWVKDVKEGAEVMALAKDLAKHIEIVGETYAAFLEAMPRWVDVAGQLMKAKVGTQAWATVVCRWQACRNVDCWYWWEQLDWVDEGKVYGPFKLKPPSNMSDGSGDDCFKIGLSAEDLFNGIKSAVGSNQDVADAKAKCTKVCE